MAIDIAHWSHQLQNTLHLAHHIPGRIRLKFNQKLMAFLSKGKLSQIDQYCSESGPLYGYQLNQTTGSLLIEYDSQVIPPDLLEQLFNSNTQQAQVALTSLLSLVEPYIDQKER
ncbi:HMA2 domain-containing protein [Neisseria sp. Ec49-e6-T10]|uniref:HMA2 domain-containing protein n=1 Tax=Neisseria sp. Ec49-e6-T10 TaxID=3140744 RepID=UPI003EBCC9F9